MNNRRFTPLIALLLVAGTPSKRVFGSDCSPIRLDGKNGSMANVAVRNQQAIGSCYAHAAAQMYDAWRFTHGENDVEDYVNFSSGFEIGQRFKIDENARIENTSHLKDTDISGGLVSEILPFLLDEGTCSQKELNGLFRADVRKSSGLDVDLYASIVMSKFNKYKKMFLEGHAEIHRRYHPEAVATDPTKLDFKITALRSDQTQVNMQKARLHEALREQGEVEILRRKILDASLAEVKDFNASILSNPDLDIHYDSIQAEDNTVKLFETLSVIDCADSRRRRTRGKFEVATHRVSTMGLFSRERSVSDRAAALRIAINAEFAKGPSRAYPIGIAYCSAVLSEGLSYRTKDFASEKCGRHASLVIGRRPDPKNQDRCQYLIRNTWGKSCSYNKDWNCEAERGSVWVDGDTLSRATHELQTIERISD